MSIDHFAAFGVQPRLHAWIARLAGSDNGIPKADAIELLSSAITSRWT